MNKLLIATAALVTVFSMPALPALAVTVFSMPAPATLTSPAPRFRAIPDVAKNTEANPEHRLVH
jgi:hypothetical protein